MITQGLGYTFNNSPCGSSLIIDQPAYTLPIGGFYVYLDTDTSGTEVLKITAGTINNSLPTVSGTIIGNENAHLTKPTSNGFIVLEMPASEVTSAAFPSDQATIKFASSIATSTKTKAFLGIAKIKVITVEQAQVVTIQQLVSGSVWGERFECGTQLDYWFSQI